MDLVKDFILLVGRFLKMIMAAIEFFKNVPLLKFFTTSYIVLIPNVVEPSTFEKFWTINLCSVAYKISTKIIVSRLSGY